MRFSAAMRAVTMTTGTWLVVPDDFECPADLVAIEIGKHEVEEDDVRDAVADFLEGLARR